MARVKKTVASSESVNNRPPQQNLRQMKKAEAMSWWDLPLRDDAGNNYRVELASVSPQQWGRSGSCYMYAVAYHAAGSPRYQDTAIVKVNLCAATTQALGKRKKSELNFNNSAATVTAFFRENLFTGEPLFVPDPSKGALEDDGTILVVAMDADANETVLLGINATSMQPIARIAAPFKTGFEFHGLFVPT